MKRLLVAFAMATAGFTTATTAEVVRLDDSSIESVLITDGPLGGCMAEVDIDISAAAPSCNRKYLTFDCNGDFRDPSVGNRFLEMAQVAYVTGKRMRFSVDTNLQHNGACVATRADLK